jgi:hypothetical protein
MRNEPQINESSRVSMKRPEFERSPRMRSVAVPTIAVLILCIVTAKVWQSQGIQTGSATALQSESAD